MKGMRVVVDNEDIKRFVEYVAENPQLYDPTAKRNDTSDKSTKLLVWAKIAKDMSVRGMNGLDWKSKWKCLRDTFVKKRKEMQLAKSQDKVDKVLGWKFYQQMTFLDPFLDRAGHKQFPRSNGVDYQHCTIIKNEEYEEDVQSEEQEEEGLEDSNSVRKRYSNSNSNNSNNSNTNTKSVAAALVSTQVKDSPGSTAGSNKKRKLNNNTTAAAEAGFAGGDNDDDGADLTTTAGGGGGEDDAAYMDTSTSWSGEGSNSHNFFQSCAYRLDRLPGRLQSYLQLQISQLFFNAENTDVPSVPIMPLPRWGTAAAATSFFDAESTENMPSLSRERTGSL